MTTAWIVDIDGTLAIHGERSPYDWARVGEDSPNEPVIDVVRALYAAGHGIIIVSGRMDSCWTETVKWLGSHSVPYRLLYMRETGDMRPDSVVKEEILDLIMRRGLDVRGVIDDRQQCVDMWRSRGLVCLQVAPGNF